MKSIVMFLHAIVLKSKAMLFVDNYEKCGKQYCRAIKTKGMVFRYMWVYSKEDTMAHTYRAVVTS